MIYEKVGNILTAEKGIIAHGCNCYGVMGAGLALQVAKKYPHVYDRYKNFCNAHKDKRKMLGDCQVIMVGSDLSIANLFTQEYPGPDAKYEHVEVALTKLFKFAILLDKDVHLPRIGCGIGGLEWDKVKALIEKTYNAHKSYPGINVTLWSFA
jgi:O-acetyl-ADP-ribose deacetylase (regulator of RNase III)